jgi:hypothetical protein
VAVFVVARQNLDAYIPDTEIIVKIPGGTAGHITSELRNNVVLVQFNVPSLGALRVNLSDLDVLDEWDLLIALMEAMQHNEVKDKVTAYKEIDKIFIRTIRGMADDSNRDKVEKLIAAYQKAVRWVDSHKEEKKLDKK